LLELTLLRSADEIKEICQRFRVHDKEIEETTALLDAVWIRIEIQMRFLSRISTTLEVELMKSQLTLLHILQGKLLQAKAQLPVEDSGNDIGDRSSKHKITDYLKRWKRVIKDSLRGLCVELEVWQNRFDPTWYLMILNNNKILDLELQMANKKRAKEPVVRPNSLTKQLDPISTMWKLRLASNPGYKHPLYVDWGQLKNPKDVPVMFSTARAILRENGGQCKLYIVEAVTSPDGSHGPFDFGQIQTDVASLVGKLQQVDPDTFGLLTCKGLIKGCNTVNNIELMYCTPHNSAMPASLRALLLDGGLILSLTSIVSIAKYLVRSVSFIHTSNFVHKSIRPENILIFPRRDSSSSLGKSFLVGFNQFRHSQQQSRLSGDSAWHRNLYRHPTRQGTDVKDRYTMQHDIYSLGVCLLEIGLWQTFVQYPGLDPAATPVPPINSEIQISDRDFEAAHLSTLGTRLHLKDRLVDMAKRRLPSRLGDVYTEIVLACLRCLDPGNEAFGDLTQGDKDGTLVGVRFIEQVLAKIDGISI
jgi:hypothetical protein